MCLFIAPFCHLKDGDQISSFLVEQLILFFTPILLFSALCTLKGGTYLRKAFSYRFI